MKPALIIEQQEVMLRPLKWFIDGSPEEDSYNEIRKKLKKATGYTWDNSILKWSNLFGDIFCFSVNYCSSTEWLITLWNAAGNTAIVSLSQDIRDERLTDENYHLLAKTTEDFTRGFINCSGCGKQQEYRLINTQRYFAGVYCNECWNTKYKAIEAKETYE